MVGVTFAIGVPIAGGGTTAASPPPLFFESRDFVIPSATRRTPLDELTADGRPTPSAIALLGEHARDHTVRITVGDTRFESSATRFDSVGVTLLGDPQIREPQSADTTGDSAHVLSASPIPWATIDRIETRHSNAVRGAILGTFLFTVVGAALLSSAGSDPGPGIAVFLAFPPAGALIGGLVGKSIPRWKHEWPPATRPDEGR